jgi:YD repeat-containing protein
MYEYRDPAGRLLSLIRDGAGNLMSLTNADGYSVHFTCDRWHRIVRAYTGVGRLTMLVEYEYDAAGRLGRARSYWFDAGQTGLNIVQWLSGIVLRRRPGWAIETREYAYDAAHRLVEIREPGALVSNEYDAGGRVVRQVVDVDEVFAFRVSAGRPGPAPRDRGHPAGRGTLPRHLRPGHPGRQGLRARHVRGDAVRLRARAPVSTGRGHRGALRRLRCAAARARRAGRHPGCGRGAALAGVHARRRASAGALSGRASARPAWPRGRARSSDRRSGRAGSSG